MDEEKKTEEKKIYMTEIQKISSFILGMALGFVLIDAVMTENKK